MVFSHQAVAAVAVTEVVVVVDTAVAADIKAATVAEVRTACFANHEIPTFGICACSDWLTLLIFSPFYINRIRRWRRVWRL